MVPKPMAYDGSFAKFDVWWRQCRSYIMDARLEDVFDKISVVLTSMTEGSAAVWAHNWEHQNQSYFDRSRHWSLNWYDFSEELKGSFMDPNQREKAMKKLNDRISLQGRTIETALVEYEQKAILAGMMTGDEQHGLFHITNLKKVLPDRVIGAMANIRPYPKTYAEFKDAACDFSARFEEMVEKRRSTPQRSFIPYSSSNRRQGQQFANTPGPSRSFNRAVTTGTASSADTIGARPRGCYACGSMDHFIRDCPQNPNRGRPRPPFPERNIRALFSSLTKEECDEMNALSQNDSTPSTDFAQAE